MSRIYWDTMLFVYWLEDHPQYARRVSQIAARMEERGDELCTSTFAVGEVLTGFQKRSATDRVARILATFERPTITVLPFTLAVASHYARIRAGLGVSAPDAIHLACAAEAGTDLFLTNDAKLLGKIVPGIQFIAGLNTDLL